LLALSGCERTLRNLYAVKLTELLQRPEANLAPRLKVRALLLVHLLLNAKLLIGGLLLRL
jgi:hypothetical protein